MHITFRFNAYSVKTGFSFFIAFAERISMQGEDLALNYISLIAPRTMKTMALSFSLCV